jgi:hypothetical protein
MRDFVLFTNTQWTQAPRLRHQVARLLAQAGHRVTFFETPAHPWQAVDRAPREIEPGIRLVSSRQLLHHQLRITDPLQRANERFVLSEIRRSLPADIDPHRCTVINFRYEYGFVRAGFPGCPMHTIIHDNFEAQCRLPWRGHITRALAETCRASDRVFVVSTPLQRRLSEWCSPELFLPWSVERYQSPSPDMTPRRDLAFWGYVDTAVDLGIVRRLAAALRERGEGGRVLLIGPTEKAHRRRRIMADLAGESNVEVQPRTDLDRLPLDRLLGAILPYVDSESVRSVTLANKSMQLLARGLPLLISSMPEFVRKPFILRLDGEEPIPAVLDHCRAGFMGWQREIEAFVLENSPESRLKQLGVKTDGPSEV